MKPITLGILGAAAIARDFTKAVLPSKIVQIKAVASRTLDKAQEFASTFGIETSYGSYEELLADKSIEVIYIPLPNSLHAEWAIKAAKAGKHILSEKPLAMNVGEVKQMFKAAHDNKVLLREAYPYLAQPQTHQVSKWLAAKEIGEVNHIRAAMSVYFNDPNNIRLIPEVGGGALYDCGVYALSFILLVAGSKPKRVSGIAQLDERGVDRTTMATIEFENGVLAHLTASFSAAYTRRMMIMGSKGSIESNYPNHPPMGEVPMLNIKRGLAPNVPHESYPVASGNGFYLEAEEFAHLVRTGKGWTGATEADSVIISQTVDAIKKSIKTGVWENV